MERVFVVLLVASSLLWGYLFGQMNSPIEDKRLYGMSETKCDDIVRYAKSSQTKAGEIVCEINMQAEDDNIKVYKGAYATN